MGMVIKVLGCSLEALASVFLLLLIGCFMSVVGCGCLAAVSIPLLLMKKSVFLL